MEPTGHARVRRPLVATVAVGTLLLLAAAIAVAPVTAAEEGSLTIDVVHENGDQATEVNALIIYQDGTHYETVSNYPSVDLQYTLSNLPTGHDYRVDAYIHDQSAGSTGTVTIPADDSLTPWDESSKSRTITVENTIQLSPTVTYRDGSTPLEGATVLVKSHEDDPTSNGKFVWREATTTEDGTTDPSPLWLYPTQGSDPGYYTVEVTLDGETIASERYDDLASDANPTIVTDETVPEYDLSVSSDAGGSVDASESGSIERGTEVTLSAVPNPEYEFDQWTGDYPSGHSSESTISITMDGDRDVEAQFDRREGDLTVDVRHQNGDRADEVDGLVVWQDSVGSEPYRKFEKYPSVAIEQRIHDLPGGHDYKVVAYVNDQYAGATDWVSVGDSDESRTITVDNSVSIRPTVYHSDGTTPLEDATVRIESHEGKEWRSAPTGSDGDTDPSKLWLYPTSEGHYDVEVYYDGERVANERVDSLRSAGTIELTTGVPLPETDVTFTVSEQGSIEGYEFSGNPIEGATITVDGRSKRTGVDGKVQFQLPAGTNEIEVSAEGFESLTDTIDVRESGAMSVSVPLTRTDAGLLELDVVSQSGDPIAANKYRVLVNGEVVEPNAAGELVLDSGMRTVAITPTEFGEDEGIGSAERTVEVRAGERTEVELSPVGENTPLDESSIEVLSIEGDDRSANGYEVGDSIESMQIEITGPHGNPVTADSLDLTVEDHSHQYTLSHTDDGQYEFSEGVFPILPATEYTTFTVGYPDDSSTMSFDAPVVANQSGLRGPVKGWSAFGTATVEVAGSQYTGVKLLRDGDYERDVDLRAETAWIVLDDDGQLVSDEAIRRKAALTAMVSYKTRQSGERKINFLKEEYPDGLERQLLYAEVGSGIVTVRDSAAELLGTVGAAAVTGGGSIAAKSTVKGATKAAAKELSKDVVRNYLQSNVFSEEDLSTTPEASIEKAIKWKARAEIEDAAAKSRRAGEILDRHDSGEVWTYEDADKYWEYRNESVTDGTLYTEIRTNMLPSGDPRDQLIDITEKIGTGVIGAPIGRLTDLIENNKLGYISEAVEETSRIRAIMALQARSYQEYGQSAQQQARSQYGNEVLYSPPGESSKSAAISIVDAPSGSFVQGERVNSTVRVENTGDTAARFFVGYSTRTTVDGDSTTFDNHGTTGRFVELPSGEATTAEVTWRVQADAPAGEEYDVLVAVWPDFPSEKIEPYQTDERQSAFQVEGGASIQTTSLQVPDGPLQIEEEQTIVADVQNTGGVAGSGLTNLTIDGDVVEQQLVHAGSDGEQAVVFYHTFQEPGSHVVRSGGVKETIRLVADSDDDGIIDTAEQERGTDPSDPDTDGDGLEDGPEVNEYGTDPTTADTDGDGYDDGAEVQAGTDPTDRSEHPIAPQRPTASVIVTPTDPRPTEAVTLDASDSSDPDGDIQSYEWDFDGDGSVDETTTSAKTTHAFGGAGTYEARVTVVDESDLQDTANATVTVASDGENVLYDTGFEDASGMPSGWVAHGNSAMDVHSNAAASGEQSLRLSGTSGSCTETTAFGDLGTDVLASDGPADDGQSVTMSFSLLPQAGAEAGCHGERNAKLMLDTDNGATYGERDLNLIEFRADGTVDATAGQRTKLGEYDVGTWTDVSIEYVRDGDEVTLTYYIDGERRGEVTRNAHSFEDDLSYLQINTGEYTTHVDDIRFETGDSGQTPSPTASFSVPSSATTGHRVEFDAGDSAPDGIGAYEWTFGDGSSATTKDPVVEHVFDDPGEYTVELTVRLNGRAETATNTVSVQDGVDLSEHAELEHAPGPVPAGEAVSLGLRHRSESLDRDTSGAIEWTFGDGNESTSLNWTAEHVFARPGTYEVTAEATDPTVTGTLATTVNVTEPVTVEGRLVGPDGDPLANDTVGAWLGPADPTLRSSYAPGETDEQGAFELTVAARDRPYEVVYWQGNASEGDVPETAPRDGRVDRFAVAAVDGAADTDLGEVALPQGHPVTLSVVDAAGEPISSDLLFRYVHRPEPGLGAYWLSNVDDNGSATRAGRQDGLEVAGPVDLEVHTDTPLNETRWSTELQVEERHDVAVGLGAAPDGEDVWIDATAQASATEVETDEAVAFDTTHARAFVGDEEMSFDAVEWSFGDGTTATGTDVSHSFDEAGTYDVEATFRRGNVSATHPGTVVVTEADDGSSGGIPLGPPSGPSPADDPAAFTVDELDVPDEVAASDTAVVEAVIENDGDESGTVDVSLAVDGEAADEASLDLEGGERGNATLAWTAPEDAESVALSVETADDDATTSVSVTGGSEESGAGNQSPATSDDPAEVQDGDGSDGETDGSGSGSEDGVDDSTPGFGAVAALAALLASAAAAGVRRRA